MLKWWSVEDRWGFFLSTVILYVDGLRKIAVPWTVCCCVVCDLHLSIVTGLKAKQPAIGLRFPYVPEVLCSPICPDRHWTQPGRLSKRLIGCSLEVTSHLHLVPAAKKDWSRTTRSRLGLPVGFISVAWHSKFTHGIQNLRVRCSRASIVTSVLVVLLTNCGASLDKDTIFFHTVRPASGVPQAFNPLVAGLCPWGKAAAVWS